jgi:hypothetical protein
MVLSVSIQNRENVGIVELVALLLRIWDFPGFNISRKNDSPDGLFRDFHQSLQPN